MDPNHEHSELFLEWLEHSWQWIVVILSSITGGLWWAMHRVFATHQSQDLCKTDLHHALLEHEKREFDEQSKAEARLQETFDQYREENLGSHLAISNKIDQVVMVIIDKFDAGHHRSD